MKRILSLIMAVAMIFSLAAPTFAADNQKAVTITLSDNIKEITTKHLQGIGVEGKNNLARTNNFQIILALVDYQDNVINFLSSEEYLDAFETAKIRQYTKISDMAYKVRIFAWDDLSHRNIISNIIEIPIKGGFIEEKIESAEDISINIDQWTEYELPSTVDVKMNTGAYKKVAVIWNKTADTDKVGEQIFKGTIEGYNKEVTLTLNVISAQKITSIENITEEADLNSEYYLPKKILATLSNGTTQMVLVDWNKPATTDKTGTFKFEGTVLGYKPKVTLTLKVSQFDGTKVVTFKNNEVEDIVTDFGFTKGKITRANLLTIKSFDASYIENSDITDLKYFENLETLNIFGLGKDINLEPLSNLKKLKSLNLTSNNITDISPLARLDSLTELKLAGNGDISDYSPIAKYYHKLIAKDFELKLFSSSVDGTIDATARAGENVKLPCCIKLYNNTIAEVKWTKSSFIAQANTVEKITGTAENGEEITYKCAVSALDDVEVVFADKAVETRVRKEIDKAKGTIYQSDIINLKSLDCFGAGVKTLVDLKYMPNLEHFGGAANYITENELKYLKPLTKLKELDLGMNKITYVGDEQFFANMSQLQELVLEENPIASIHPNALVGLENLSSFIIEDTPLKNIECARKLTHLETILMRNSNVSDISPLSGLKELKSFWADNNPLESISALSNLTKLEWVQIANTKLRDISPLSKSVGLKRLDARDNHISNVEALREMVNMEWLQLSNNEITDISAIAKLVELNYLELDGNKITSIEALRKMVKLTILHLKGNPIIDFAPVSDFYENIKNKDFTL